MRQLSPLEAIMEHIEDYKVLYVSGFFVILYTLIAAIMVKNF